MKNKRMIQSIAMLLALLIAGIALVKVLGRDVPSSLENMDITLNEEQLEGDYIQLVLRDGVMLLSNGYDFQLERNEVIEKINAQDEYFTFTVRKEQAKMGTLEVVVREIENSDQFVFTQFQRTAEKEATIPMKLVFENEKNYDFFQFEEEIEQEHDRVFGIDHTTNVKGLYSIGSAYNLLLSQNYISTELREVYEDGKESVLRELINEDTNLNIDIEQKNLVYNLELRTTGVDQISESWFLLSDDNLFNSEETMKSYKEFTNHEFISSRKWLTAAGPYTKLPWSIEPATKLGYGRNLVVLQGIPFVESYEKEEERFHYNMIVNSVNYLWDFKQATTLWETEYTSTWLKNDYGIIAPYTDTRHNENIALFLSEAGAILNNEELVESYLLYADFLGEQQAIDNVLRTDNGYYVLDYYSEAQTKKTHVSLNHALGEMSYLFNAYRETNKDNYLAVALQIKQAIEDIGEQWINPENGDLWYQINGDYTFEGKDYDTLTLRDLVTSLEYYDEFELPYGEVYTTLMDSKVNFIVENDVEMKVELYEKLLALGYEKQLENYEHVINFEE